MHKVAKTLVKCTVGASLKQAEREGTISRPLPDLELGDHRLQCAASVQTPLSLARPHVLSGSLQSLYIVLGLATGAILGAISIHANPFGDDRGLMFPVALGVLYLLRLHDSILPPPGGWKPPEGLTQPLVKGEGIVTSA